MVVVCVCECVCVCVSVCVCEQGPTKKSQLEYNPIFLFFGLLDAIFCPQIFSKFLHADVTTKNTGKLTSKSKVLFFIFETHDYFLQM